MAETMSLAGHAAMNLEEASRLYRGWHPGGSEVAGSEAFARPPPYTHRFRFGMSRPVRTLKDIELVEG